MSSVVLSMPSVARKASLAVARDLDVLGRGTNGRGRAAEREFDTATQRVAYKSSQWK